MERQTGIAPARLKAPRFPEELRYLWRWFREIHDGRTINGFCPTKASQLDVWVWQQNSQIKLEPWEARAINDLGSVWMKVRAEFKPTTVPPPPAR